MNTTMRRHDRRHNPGTGAALEQPSAVNTTKRRKRDGACYVNGKNPRDLLLQLATTGALLLLRITATPCSAAADRLSASVLSVRGGAAAAEAGATASVRQRRQTPPSVASEGAQAAPSSSSSSEPLLKSFLRARCGPTGAGVWLYEGRLVDPLNGLTIANVRGVELVRCLAVTDPSGAQRERYKRRAGDLAIAPTVSSPSLSPNLEYAGTLLCRKLFCYTPPGTSGGGSGTFVASGGGISSADGGSGGGGSSTLQLLRKVRLRPTSPERTIPVDQAAAVYDTATTYCQVAKRPPSKNRGRHQADPDVSANHGEVWAVHTEYSDGRCLYSAAAVDNDPLQRVLEYTVYARPQPAFWNRHQRLDWARWLGQYYHQPEQQGDGGGGASSSVISPRRAALVQLGPSSSGDGASGVGKFGARETYQYATAFGRCSCRYTRYGEGPAWYGPGRMCTLELSGKRVDRWTELPSDLSQLVYERVVGFSSVNSPIPQDDNLASRAVQVFRGMGASRLRIAPLDKDGDAAGSSVLASKWNRVLSAWDRVKGATSLTLGGGEGAGDGGRGGGRGSGRRTRR